MENLMVKLADTAKGLKSRIRGGQSEMPIEITERNTRGFHQYGEPVKSAYGDMVEVYESSAASGPHCWLRIYDDGQSGITRREAGNMTAHLNVEQATAVRDRLTAFIEEVPHRWNTPKKSD